MSGLKHEITPEFSLDIITVSAQYRRGSPLVVEQAICVRVEQALQGVDGIKRMTGVASEGRVAIALEVVTRYDVRKVVEEVKTSVDGIDTFPDAVQKSFFQRNLRRDARSLTWPSPARPTLRRSSGSGQKSGMG